MASLAKIEAAAKAAYPDLWPDDYNKLPGPTKAAITNMRQQATEIVVRALNAADQVEDSAPDGDEAPDTSGAIFNTLADVTVALPQDAAMLEQVLTVVTYVAKDGRTAYVVRTMGEGLRTSWLGMLVLAQDYLLKLPAAWRAEDEGN